MRQGGPCSEQRMKGCPGPGSWNLSATGHRLRRSDDLGHPVCPGEPGLPVEMPSKWLGLEIRMKVWPEDLRCVCVCP